LLWEKLTPKAISAVKGVLYPGEFLGRAKKVPT
jgi:hypothetical protein